MVSVPLDLSAQTARLAVTPSPLGRPGGPGLWLKGWKLPDYIENVARGIMQGGEADESRAIATAIAAVKRWASGGGKVTPEVRAAAAKAVAEWSALKAAAPGTKSHAHASTAEAVELSFSAAAHPRVAAGNATGGQFTAGGAQPPAKGKTKAAPKAKTSGSAAKTARARRAELRQQASDDRAKAAALNAQVRALDKAIAAKVKAAAAAKKAAASAKASAPKAQTAAQAAAAAKAAASASTSTKTAASKKTVTVKQLRDRRASLRARVQSLLSQARSLDQQAAAITLAGDTAFLDLAFAEALAERVPAGKPDGGRFAHPLPVLTSHDTPAQAAKAINAMEAAQRAAVQSSAMPPPGFEWHGDRLRQTS